MATINETMRVLAWLFTTLGANTVIATDAPGGVWRGLAAPGTLAPYVVFNHQGGADTLGVAGVRLMERDLYQVRVRAPATLDATTALIADAIDAELQLAPISTVNGDTRILSSVREQSLHLDEIVDGVIWATHGGLYRIISQAV